jgi:hypothetical protein
MAPATVSTIDITAIRWRRKGLQLWLTENERPAARAGPLPKIDAEMP